MKPGKNFLVAGYVYTNDASKQVPFKPEEIIHFKRFNPNSQYRGIGTVAAAELAIDTDETAKLWCAAWIWPYLHRALGSVPGLGLMREPGEEGKRPLG